LDNKDFDIIDARCNIEVLWLVYIILIDLYSQKYCFYIHAIYYSALNIIILYYLCSFQIGLEHNLT